MSDTLTTATPATGPERSGARPSLSWRDRVAALTAGFGPGARGFQWRPEPRFPGSVVAGRQLLAGNFRFGGALMDAPGRSPWSFDPPNEAFRDALHGFEWLGDLAALPHSEGRETAQAWVLDWVRRYGRGAGPGWTPDLTGRRQIRWITHGLFLLNGMERGESRAFHKALGRQARFLASRWPRATPGLPRFEALTGLVYSACSLLGMEAHLDAALDALGRECARDIDEEGGIVTRNPEDLLEVFILLTWISQLLTETGRDPDPAVESAVQRIAPTLRSLRHADGSLVRAHGGGRGAPGRLVAALVQSGVRPSQVKGLAMGFARLAQGRVTVIADAAPPMLGPRSTRAHAGTLGFELTSADDPVIVSCGSGARFDPEWRKVGRATASHSTLCIEGHASARFAPGAERAEDERPPLGDGPTEVLVQEKDTPGGQAVTMSHDGWRRSHGLTHLRNLTLEDQGTLLRGEDALAAFTVADRALLDAEYARHPADTGLRYALRFHLHPDIRAAIDLGGTAVSLTLKSGETWVFRHSGNGELALKPSLFFDARRLKPRATKQIVLSARMKGYGSVVGWSLARPIAFMPHGRLPGRYD
ncbi:heparinase II/III family protein [Roseibacterium sp. SDUM158017]|uniref:heparinase II/III family protein n=1 Tax=Roseicyclus salinarum TaxID=3036773 RepID=UPI0024155276|nr:heparinase II/III family protein [Roseibacterium sp. SDUM158017]MDG4650547.1 heparinase II/III family protein [Roseibacterium sp. SDUM158017]